MNSSSKKKIIEALKDQRDIFGDDLFEEKTISVKPKTIVTSRDYSAKEPTKKNHSCKRTFSKFNINI